MKKVLALLLVTATLFLTACGGDNSYVKGVVDGDTFSTEFMSMSFTLPSDDWFFATDEEISAMMGLAAEDVLDVSEFEKKAMELQNVYDMMAQDVATKNNIMLIHENLSMVAGGTDYSEEEYLEIVKSGIAATQSNIPYVYEDYYTETVAGQTFTVLESAIVEAGITQYYFTQKNGDFMSCYIITIVNDTPIEDILAQFTAVE